MVSIEQIKKANNLSMELKKHGFASDFGDAFSQAERIVDRNKKSPEVGLAETVVLEESYFSEKDLQDVLERVQMLERFKEFAQKRDRDQKEQISMLIEKLNEMVKSIKLVEMNQISFEKQILDLKSLSPTPSPTNDPVPEAAPQPAQTGSQQPISAPDNKSSEPIDASGIAPADVSIEKIFYTGSGNH